MLHTIVGVSSVFIFLLTGQYLEFYYPEMEGVNDRMRMMFRSRHIYILLAGLVNVGIGSYFVYREERWRQALQVAGSALIIVAPLLLIGAFFSEPKLAGMQRHWTLPGVVAVFTGTLLHLLGGIAARR